MMTLTARQPRETIEVPAWARETGAIRRVTVRDAASLDADALRAAVRDAYLDAFDHVGDRHVVRVWNVVPEITAPLGNGDRYMAFNAGRAEAMRARFGDRLGKGVPAASGVGGDGGDVTIDLLALDAPGEPLENPRQTPAFRYSSKYGALPPCFARAVRAMIRGEPKLLVSGTAAIVGEDTRAIGDVDAQLAITLDNLRGLLASDGGRDSLDRFETLRVYLPRSTFDLGLLRATIRRHFASCGEIEFVRAELCRRDLLVEIEGVARRGEA